MEDRDWLSRAETIKDAVDLKKDLEVRGLQDDVMRLRLGEQLALDMRRWSPEKGLGSGDIRKLIADGVSLAAVDLERVAKTVGEGVVKGETVRLDPRDLEGGIIIQGGFKG